MVKMKNTKEDVIFITINYIILGLFTMIIAYPLYYIIIASISEPVAVVNGEANFLPIGFNLGGYRRIFENKDIWRGYVNTFEYTIVGTIINVLLTMGIAYPLSRKYFSGKKLITIFLMITMYFNGGLIPTYMLVSKLNLKNTFAVMVLLGAVSVINIIVARTFLESNISSELEEAASIDGCSQIRFFSQMVLPLSKAIIVVLILYYGIGHWNDFMRALIYLNDAKKYPLQMVIRVILIQAQLSSDSLEEADVLAERIRTAESMKYGVIIVASLPVLIIYPFLQKYFQKGVMIGSVKG